MNLHVNIFAQEGPQDPEYPKSLYFSRKNSKMSFRGRHLHMQIYTYVRNPFIFLLGPVSSKNIEICNL